MRSFYSRNKLGVFIELKEDHYCWSIEGERRECYKMSSLVMLLEASFVELWRSGEFRFLSKYLGKPLDVFEILLCLL